MTSHGRAIDNNVYDISAILHPWWVYDRPRDVLANEELTVAEKRSILASWASDAAAVTSCPWAIPDRLKSVSIDDILKALSELDNGPRPPGGSRLGANRPPESQKRHEGGSHGWTLTKGIRTSRSAPVERSLVGSGAKYGKPRMIPTEDWLADLESKIADLERNLGLDSHPGA